MSSWFLEKLLQGFLDEKIKIDPDNSSETYKALLQSQKNLLCNILQLPPEASERDIKKRYYALALTYHPDKNKTDPNAAEKFRLFEETFKNLMETNEEINKLNLFETVESVTPESAYLANMMREIFSKELMEFFEDLSLKNIAWLFLMLFYLPISIIPYSIQFHWQLLKENWLMTFEPYYSQEEYEEDKGLGYVMKLALGPTTLSAVLLLLGLIALIVLYIRLFYCFIRISMIDFQESDTWSSWFIDLANNFKVFFTSFFSIHSFRYGKPLFTYIELFSYMEYICFLFNNRSTSLAFSLFNKDPSSTSFNLGTYSNAF